MSNLVQTQILNYFKALKTCRKICVKFEKERVQSFLWISDLVVFFKC